MLYTIIVVAGLFTYVRASRSKQFAKELWEYNISDTFHGRAVESIAVAKDVQDVAYISFSEQGTKNCSNGSRKDMQERVECNPMVAKILLNEQAVVEWSTSLSDFEEDTRFTSLVVSPDGGRLYVIATLMNAEGGHKFYVQTINTRYGVATGVIFLSALAGSQIVGSSAMDENGIYFCGRSTMSSVEQGSLKSDEKWEFLLGQISLSGSLLWRYNKNIANITCEAIDISGGYVYTAGTTRSALMAGVLHKHSKDGELVWGKRIRSTVDLALKPVDVIATGDGVFMSSGFEASHAPLDRVVVQKVSEGGTLLWTREMGDGGNGSAVPRIGYHNGFVYGLVKSGVRGVLLGRVGRFGDAEDDMLMEIDSGVDVQSVWADVNRVFVVVSGNGGVRTYGVGIDDDEGVTDSGKGRYGYRIKATVAVNEEDTGSVKDYLREVARDGTVTTEDGDSGVLVVIAVRGDDVSRLGAMAERVKQALEMGDDGRNEVAKRLGVEVALVGDVVVEGVGPEFEGARSTLGVGVGVVVGVGLVVAVVVVWFCVTRSMKSIGDGIMSV